MNSVRIMDTIPRFAGDDMDTFGSVCLALSKYNFAPNRTMMSVAKVNRIVHNFGISNEGVGHVGHGGEVGHVGHSGIGGMGGHGAHVIS